MANEGSKKLQATEKSRRMLKKFFTIIFVLYAIFFIVWFGLKKYGIDPKDIYSRVSSSHVATSVPTKDALYIREWSIMRFKSFLKAGDYENAYNMYTDEYKSYLSYEDFVPLINAIDWDSFDIADIKSRNDYTIEASVVYKYKNNDELQQTIYMLYPNELNAQNIKMSPDNFLYYFKDITKKVKDVEITINDCLILNNKIKINVDVKNTSLFSSIDFSEIRVSQDSSLYEKQPINVHLEKGETQNIKLEFDNTRYMVPNNIKLVQNLNDEKQRFYTFFFEK